MLTKTKKIALLTTGLVGTLLATTIGGVVLSSCTNNTTIDDPKNEFGNKFTSSINWNNQEEVSRLNIDKNGLVYSDQNRTILIGLLPGTSISELVIPRSVKQISGYMDKTNDSNGVATGAFEGQITLTSVKFEGSSVEYIGNQAFKGCTSLTTIQLPKTITTIGNNAFENTGSIAKINLDNVKFIGNSAFKSAFVNLPTSTTEINLSNVQFIDTMAFMGNPSIKSINLNNNKVIRNIQSQAFEGSNLEGTIDLSNATLLRTIGNSAFKGTTGLESVILPNSLTNLGATTTSDGLGVFQNSSVKLIDLSKTQISALHRNTFNGAINLTEVKFPESLKQINLSAFSGTGFTSLDLSNTNITNINNGTFQNVSNLTDIKFPATLTSLGDNALQGTSLISVDLSNTKLTTITQGNFERNTSLTDIKFPATLTTIANAAFRGTTNLKTIDFSNTQINSIGQEAFKESGITSISLPKLANSTQFTTIGDRAFQNCYFLRVADFRFTNLRSLSTAIFENNRSLEYLLVKSPDLGAIDSPNPSDIQKQITTIGAYAFKGASNLRGIFHVTDGDTNEVWTPTGVIVASPFLTQIGALAFFGVNKIEVFDASLVKNPSNGENFISDGLFYQPTNNSSLKAVILPNALDSIGNNNNYHIGSESFTNNQNLAYLGTKKTLEFSSDSKSILDINKATPSEYLSKFKKSGFQVPLNLNVIGREAFMNTGFETINFSQAKEFSGGHFGSNDLNNNDYGKGAFSNNLKLKKIILPTWLKLINNNMFNNLPLLEEVNFDMLSNLEKMGSGNFTNFTNFKSSKNITDDSNSNGSSKEFKASTELTLDLSNTKLALFNQDTFTSLPEGISKVKLPTTINNTFSTLSNVLTTIKSNNNNVVETAKIDFSKIEFINSNGEDTTQQTYNKLMTNPNGTKTATPALFTDTNIDLTSILTLTTLSPNTFSLNKGLTTLKLPADVTTWEIANTTGQGDSLNSNYSSAAFSRANVLNEISFNGFKKNDQNQFVGNIVDLVSADWNSNIKDNNKLWNSMALIMNSLGYDATLESATSPFLGVIDKWIAPTDNAPTSGTRPWIEKDLTENDLKGADKWWTNKPAVVQTRAADKNISDTAPNSNESAYFKHNGIIWTWTATVTSGKITITLTPDPTTLPNVYKATVNSSNAYITTFRTAKHTTTSTTTKAGTPSFGVNIKFNIAITATKK